MPNLDQFSVETFVWGKHKPTVQDVVRITQRAEELGYYSVNVPMTNYRDDYHLDTLVPLTAMLQATSTIRVCPDALPLPILPPYYWAKYIASLDVMSGGRIIAGVCAGSPGKPHTAHGASPKNRGRKLEEQLEIIIRLWTEEKVTHEGEFYQLDDVSAEPKPVQNPHPPIWIAGGVKSVSRAARFADYLDIVGQTLDQVRDDYVPALQKANEQYNRDTKIAAWVSTYVTPDRSLSEDEIAEYISLRTGRSMQPREVAAGSPEQCAAKIREYQELGVSRFILDFQRFAEDPPATALEQIALFAEKVAPLIQESA